MNNAIFIKSNYYKGRDQMKRFHYNGMKYFDEFNRVWIMSRKDGRVSWELTDEVLNIPSGCSRVEYSEYSI